MLEILGSLAPISELVVDFSNVREFHGAALRAFFKAMEPLAGVRVALRGLTEHQSRLLKFLGFPVAAFGAGA
jgi:hypothetical protein